MTIIEIVLAINLVGWTWATEPGVWSRIRGPGTQGESPDRRPEQDSQPQYDVFGGPPPEDIAYSYPYGYPPPPTSSTSFVAESSSSVTSGELELKIILSRRFRLLT